MKAELSKRAKASKFTSLASAGPNLYALDNNGRVWLYHPYGKRADGSKSYAFWGSITTHRAPTYEQEVADTTKQEATA